MESPPLNVEDEPRSEADSAENAGAPEHEIEITPEMIEAGIRAYRDRDMRFMLERDVVADIFISMLEAMPKMGTADN